MRNWISKSSFKSVGKGRRNWKKLSVEAESIYSSGSFIKVEKSRKSMFFMLFLYPQFYWVVVRVGLVKPIDLMGVCNDWIRNDYCWFGELWNIWCSIIGFCATITVMFLHGELENHIQKSRIYWLKFPTMPLSIV